MKRGLSVMLAVILVIALAVPALGAEGKAPYVVDNAKLLTASERKALESRAEALSNRYEFDFVILTVDSIGSATSTAYADDYFDYNGYGQGSDFSGILLLVSMADRDWALSTCGYGIEAFTDYGQEYMMDRVLPLLSSGDYAEAFGTYLRVGEDLLRQAKNGKPLDVPEPHSRFPWVSLVVFMLVGFGLAFMPMGVLKKEVKNVSSQPDALDYVSGNGLELTARTDRFLYSHVTKSPRPKESSSSGSSSRRSGGSSTHRSSSGRSHGGSRGKF